jgi:hypothetical protein
MAISWRLVFRSGCAGMPGHFPPSGMSFIKLDFAVAFVVVLAFAALTIHQEMRQPIAHDFTALDNIALR